MKRLVLFAVVAVMVGCAPALGQVLFTVNSELDDGDATPGDGVCLAASGGCTLRAAIEENNATPEIVATEIKIDVPHIAVEYPGDGFKITHAVHLVGEIPASVCGQKLPVRTFGAGIAMPVIERVSDGQEDDHAIGFETTAHARIEALVLKGFETGVKVTSGDADLVCLDISGGDTGVIYDGAGYIRGSAIHGNTVGIELRAADIDIRNDCIGTLADCATPDGNLIGVRAVGAMASIASSVVSGNETGVFQSGFETFRVTNSLIGTDWTGTADVGNRIGIKRGTTWPDTPEGATVADNVISGNDSLGVECSHCVVRRNLIGVDSTGMIPLPNGIGVRVWSSNGYGGNVEGNVISGNAGTGLEIPCGRLQIAVGNVIGMDASGTVPLPNGGDGIRVTVCGYWDVGARTTLTIGGGAPQDRNVIAHNGGHGVHVVTPDPVPPAVHVRGNSIFDNTGLGIAFASGIEALPVPSVVSTGWENGALRLVASVNGEPSGAYLVEYFSSGEPDPSGYGEGESPIAVDTLKTGPDGMGVSTVEVDSASVPADRWITATSTWIHHWAVGWPSPTLETGSFSNALQVGTPATDSEPAVPLPETALGPGYPNPFDRQTTIPFALSRAGAARIALYDALGRQVLVLVDRSLSAGQHSIRLSASGLAAGAYWCVLDTNGTRHVRQVSVYR